MTQQETNAAWLQQFDSNVGKCTLLVPPARDSGLRRPYQYALPIKKALKLSAALRAILKPTEPKLLQCALCEFKPTKYGCRLNIFLLGYAPGLTGNETGLNAEQWQDITARLRDILKASLPEAMVYIEPWTAKAKFQARFETYIQHSETLKTP